MDDLRKRILNEIFVAPSVVLPIAGGGTAWLLSWALGSVATLNLVGLVGVMVGIGWFATRFIFQLDSITEKAMRDQIESRLREEEKKLNELDQKLYADRDQRPREAMAIRARSLGRRRSSSSRHVVAIGVRMPRTRCLSAF